ncbi:MAG TPA: hypothetical protein VFQ53_43305 [Kofleriaceae bacterium]|nr:hypothetical protein [Kofleriaceae bacterium]
MANILIGIVLLVIGIMATATSKNTVYIGAIAAGTISIVRGLVVLSKGDRPF